MKIKGSTVTGFLTYIPGLTYTKNDFILYNNRIYIVTGSSFDGKVTPDKSKDCEDYVSYNSFGSRNSSENSIVTSRSIFGIVKNYFKGLTGNGEIERITVDSLDDLNKYNETGAYNCRIRKEFIGTIPPGNYLLRVYKTNENDVIQDLLNYESGLIIIRNVTNGRMFILPSSSSNNQERLVSNLEILNNRISDILSVDKYLHEKSFNYSNIGFSKIEDKKYRIRGVNEGEIVHLIFFNRKEKETIQYSKEIYLTSLTKDIKIYLTELDYFTSSFDGHNIDIEVTNSHIELAKSYVSKGNI